jgi:hypothetical protein
MPAAGIASRENLSSPGAHVMSKSLNQKKDAKKKPQKTLKEKRAEKHGKTDAKVFLPK